MKILKYKFLSCEVNHGTEEEPKIEQVILEKSMVWNEANEEIAKKEAYNGEYSIEDNGQPEPESSNSNTEALLARVAALESSMLHLT